MHGDLPANPAERRGSTTMTNTHSFGHRGSVTKNTGSLSGGTGGRAGSGGGGATEGRRKSSVNRGRRKSSVTLNLNFMGVEKIVPITEDKNAKGEKDDEKEDDEKGGEGTAVVEEGRGSRSTMKPLNPRSGGVSGGAVVQSRG